VERADVLSDGWLFWLDWQRAICPDNTIEIQAVEADRGRYLGYVRAVGRRRIEVKMQEPIVSVPTEYSKKQLLRNLPQ
jgi:hypothetical protein